MPDPLLDLAGITQEQVDSFLAGAELDHATNAEEWHRPEHVAWRAGRGLRPCPFCDRGSGEPWQEKET